MPDDVFPLPSSAREGAQAIYSKFFDQLSGYLNATVDTRSLSTIWSSTLSDSVGGIGFRHYLNSTYPTLGERSYLKTHQGEFPLTAIISSWVLPSPPTSLKDLNVPADPNSVSILTSVSPSSTTISNKTADAPRSSTRPPRSAGRSANRRERMATMPRWLKSRTL